MNSDLSQTQSKKVRTRFAPSPTGFLHIGSVRTCLFNFLYAKKMGGDFVLRIEDTDKERSKPEFEEDIKQGLKWLGIIWDEGPDTNGKFGPYRQMDRLDIYEKYARQLLEQGHAYYCFCSEEELEAKKQEMVARGHAPIYDGKCSNISKEEAQQRIAAGEKAVIRFKTQNKVISFTDLIWGKVDFDASLFGDFVIAKDTRSPLYNFAAAVDDYLMEITHIIRGEEHLSNTPRQMMIQSALGFSHPQYAHLPLILGPDKTKLSKRHNAEPVGYYKQKGYLPQALNNFIAFLGWNPGTEREMFSMPELINEFSFERCRKSGSIFNIAKLDWYNGMYIRQTPLDKLTELLIPYYQEKNLIEKISDREFKITATNQTIDFATLSLIVSLYQERLVKLEDIIEATDLFFIELPSYEKDLLLFKDMTYQQVANSIDKCIELLSNAESFQKDYLQTHVLNAIQEANLNRGQILWPLRVALTGKKASAGPFEIAEILGKDLSLKRLNFAKKLLG